MCLQSIGLAEPTEIEWDHNQVGGILSSLWNKTYKQVSHICVESTVVSALLQMMIG